MSGKRLYKSRDKKICGVCGGLGEYFEIDPTIIRVVYVILVLCTGIGILPYIIAAIIMDDNPQDAEYKSIEQNTFSADQTNSYSANNTYESDEPVGFDPYHSEQN